MARAAGGANEHHPRPGAALSARVLGVPLGLLGVLAAGEWAGRLPGGRGLPLAVGVQVGLMWWALYLLWAVPPPLDGRWFAVRPWEEPLYRRLGVYVYMGLLRAVGWERLRRGARGFGGTRTTLRRLERQTREAEFSHVLLGFITLGLLALSAGRGQWDMAGWWLLTGLFFHGYPVMLQRTLRARLARLGVG